MHTYTYLMFSLLLMHMLLAFTMRPAFRAEFHATASIVDQIRTARAQHNVLTRDTGYVSKHVEDQHGSRTAVDTAVFLRNTVVAHDHSV